MSRIRRLVAALREVDRQRARVDDLERELVRLSPQVAALEERVESLRQRLDDPSYAGSEAEQSQARSLVEEVRAEHARVRARISAATVFEERLRVLEARLGVDGETGGDLDPR